MSNRPDWDSYFMKIAEDVSTRSTCRRRNVGAILVKDKHIISTGYNGAPKDCVHCDEKGCLREIMGVPSGERHEICRGAHAEMNAVAQAAAVGCSTDGAVCYCTDKPCSFCAKILINAGIKAVCYRRGYADELSDQLFKEAGVELHQN